MKYFYLLYLGELYMLPKDEILKYLEGMLIEGEFKAPPIAFKASNVSAFTLYGGDLASIRTIRRDILK